MWSLRGSIESGEAFAFPNPAMDAVGELWLLTATLMVLFMQAGFLLLEAGAVRSKNTINVAQKNITDFVVCGCIFLLVGGQLMLGTSTLGLFGFGGLDFSDQTTRLQFLFQFAFCATAATIVSGAVAERMRFTGYVCLTVVMAGITYPLFAHLVWGNAILPENPSLLANLGFLDFAGSTVVHVIGGTAALAAVLAVGPRLGRFDAAGKVQPIRGHSSVLSNSGIMVLMVGWIGFNAGGASPQTSLFSMIVLNTVVAMSFGGAAGLLYGAWRTGGKHHPKTTMVGILGALVSITAGCAYVGPYGAAFIGFFGGWIALQAAHTLLHNYKIDDPIDAVATHAVAGIWGTLAFVFFMDPEQARGGVFGQLAIQTLGTLVACIWSFGVTYFAIKLVQRVTPLRVSEQEEALGLNMSEHDDAFDIDAATQLLKEAPADLPVLTPALTDQVDNAPDYDDQVRAFSHLVTYAKTSHAQVQDAQETIEDMATRDQLTGLCNRAAFQALAHEQLRSAVADERNLIVLFIDLDGFKAINDGFGHSTGDAVLQDVGLRLHRACGQDALVSRFGGDEFVVLLSAVAPNTPLKWRELCDDILLSLSEKMMVHGREVYVGSSIGVAEFPKDSCAIDPLLKRADLALYEAKAKGKGCWVAFEPVMEERAMRRSNLETDMRKAADTQQFYFLFQPQVSVNTGILNGFEALMRWDHPVHGPISPAEFIPIAEETGIISTITERLMLDACRMARHWPLIEGQCCKLSVNISAVQFQRSNLVGMIKTCLQKSGLPPEGLEIELTENALIGDKEHAKQVLREIRALGVDIAIDDFGTGYSSLSYLQEFPMTRLKVDQAFVKDIEGNGDAQRITKTIIDLGKSLGLNVIAEGVETEGQRAFLKDHNCDDLQGFLYSPPISASQASALLHDFDVQNQIDTHSPSQVANARN